MQDAIHGQNLRRANKNAISAQSPFFGLPVTFGSWRAHAIKDTALNEPRRKLYRSRFFATVTVHLPVAIGKFPPTPTGARQCQAVLVFFFSACFAPSRLASYIFYFLG